MDYWDYLFFKRPAGLLTYKACFAPRDPNIDEREFIELLFYFAYYDALCNKMQLASAVDTENRISFSDFMNLHELVGIKIPADSMKQNFIRISRGRQMISFVEVCRYLALRRLESDPSLGKNLPSRRKSQAVVEIKRKPSTLNIKHQRPIKIPTPIQEAPERASSLHLNDFDAKNSKRSYARTKNNLVSVKRTGSAPLNRSSGRKNKEEEKSKRSGKSTSSMNAKTDIASATTTASENVLNKSTTETLAKNRRREQSRNSTNVKKDIHITVKSASENVLDKAKEGKNMQKKRSTRSVHTKKNFLSPERAVSENVLGKSPVVQSITKNQQKQSVKRANSKPLIRNGKPVETSDHVAEGKSAVAIKDENQDQKDPPGETKNTETANISVYNISDPTPIVSKSNLLDSKDADHNVVLETKQMPTEQNQQSDLTTNAKKYDTQPQHIEVQSRPSLPILELKILPKISRLESIKGKNPRKLEPIEATVPISSKKLPWPEGLSIAMNLSYDSVRAIFQKFDVNNNGRLTWDELVCGVKELYPNSLIKNSTTLDLYRKLGIMENDYAGEAELAHFLFFLTYTEFFAVTFEISENAFSHFLSLNDSLHLSSMVDLRNAAGDKLKNELTNIESQDTGMFPFYEICSFIARKKIESDFVLSKRLVFRHTPNHENLDEKRNTATSQSISAPSLARASSSSTENSIEEIKSGEIRWPRRLSTQLQIIPDLVIEFFQLYHAPKCKDVYSINSSMSFTLVQLETLVKRFESKEQNNKLSYAEIHKGIWEIWPYISDSNGLLHAYKHKVNKPGEYDPSQFIKILFFIAYYERLSQEFPSVGEHSLKKGPLSFYEVQSTQARDTRKISVGEFEKAHLIVGLEIPPASDFDRLETERSGVDFLSDLCEFLSNKKVAKMQRLFAEIGNSLKQAPELEASQFVNIALMFEANYQRARLAYNDLLLTSTMAKTSCAEVELEVIRNQLQSKNIDVGKKQLKPRIFDTIRIQIVQLQERLEQERKQNHEFETDLRLYLEKKRKLEHQSRRGSSNGSLNSSASTHTLRRVSLKNVDPRAQEIVRDLKQEITRLERLCGETRSKLLTK